MTEDVETRDGIAVARRLVMVGAEVVAGTEKDELPFSQAGITAFRERWEEVGWQMREHELGVAPTWTRLHDAFALTDLEYWLVLLCGAAERYPEVATVFGLLMDEPHASLLTPLSFGLLMHAARGVAVEEALGAALGGGGPARLGLIEAAEPSPGRPVSHQMLRLAAAEIPLLFGLAAAESVRPRATRPQGPARPAFDSELLRVAAAFLKERRMIALRGPSARAQRQFCVDLGGLLGVEPRFFTAEDGSPRLQPLLRLHDALPVLDLTEVATTSPSLRAALLDARPSVRRLVILANGQFSEPEIPSIGVPRLGWSEAERIWHATTGDRALAGRLAGRFRVSAAEAVAACRDAELVAASLHAASAPESAVGAPTSAVKAPSREELISAEVLKEGESRMGRQVTRLRSEASLAHLVVPDALRAQLNDMVDWQRSSARVDGMMGLRRRSPLGRGLTCLFSGPSGTGKTFAAQCLANELGLNLYRIDLSQVVSKYIGETEKALSTVFDEAESGHGVLLFDEADALFGKRSDVKDAHDRYANIEVGYLLQRTESYEGIAILTTNLRSNIDAAFLRRIRFLLEFPMPDAAMRRCLWEQSLPDAALLAPDLDISPYAERFRLSGGSIQNIGLAAAHMAAATPEGLITMHHLVRATYRELEKSGQSRERGSFGPLAAYLPTEVA